MRNALANFLKQKETPKMIEKNKIRKIIFQEFGDKPDFIDTVILADEEFVDPRLIKIVAYVLEIHFIMCDLDAVISYKIL